MDIVLLLVSWFVFGKTCKCLMKMLISNVLFSCHGKRSVWGDEKQQVVKKEWQ